MANITPFEEFIMRKADKAPEGPYWTTMQILKNACMAKKMPIFNRRPSSVTWGRYFALVPPKLKPEAIKVWQNFQRSERYKKSEREAEARAKARRMTQKGQ